MIRTGQKAIKADPAQIQMAVRKTPDRRSIISNLGWNSSKRQSCNSKSMF
jgi:hypothetical protein